MINIVKIIHNPGCSTNITAFIKLLNTLILLLLLVTFSGCKKANDNYAAVDYSYFPLKLKRWIIYNVMYIDINENFGRHDTSRYQLKEIIDTVFLDNSNRTNYRVERYTRPGSGYSWEIKDVWFECIADNSAQKVEENIRYVKIRFPVELNKTWNGNIFNTLDEQDYKITSLDTQDTIIQNAFNEVMTVTQEDKLNAIEKYYSIEKYAKNIGLVSKQIIDISSAYTSSTIPIEQRIKVAELYYQDILTYGNE